MKKNFLFLAILICLSSTAYAEDNKAGELIKKISEYNRTFSAFSSRYTRDIITKSMSLLGRTSSEDKSEGTIYFKSPYYLKVMQESPGEELLIASDNEVVWYIAEKNEAHLYSKDKFGKEFGLLMSLFAGVEEAFDKFIINIIEPRDGKSVLELIPDPPWQEVSKVEIYISDDRKISSIRIYNHLDTLTYFDLEEFTPEVSLNDNFFSFIPPPGTLIITEP